MRQINKEEYKRILLEEISYFDNLCHELNLKYWVAFGSLLGAVRHNGFIPWDDDFDIMMPRDDYNKLLDYFMKNDTGYYEIVNHNNRKAPYLISRISDKRYWLDFQHARDYDIGIFIDIYPVDGAGNKLTEVKKYVKKCSFYSKLFIIQDDDERLIEHSFLKKVISFLIYKSFKIFQRPNAALVLEKMVLKKKYSENNYVGCMVWITDSADFPIQRKFYNKIIRHRFESIEVNIPADFDEILKAQYGDYMKLPPEENRIGHHFYNIFEK